VKLTCNLSNDSWILTNIYVPCHPERRANFINWFAKLTCQMKLTGLLWEISISLVNLLIETNHMEM
jgi:hypothetical protein